MFVHKQCSRESTHQQQSYRRDLKRFGTKVLPQTLHSGNGQLTIELRSPTRLECHSSYATVERNKWQSLCIWKYLMENLRRQWFRSGRTPGRADDHGERIGRTRSHLCTIWRSKALRHSGQSGTPAWRSCFLSRDLGFALPSVVMTL